MKIEDARLCLNCEEVIDIGVCPVCASEHTYLISNWLKERANAKRK
jgi:RNA polymerase subunit RPABC4/transcription elongation factor Spt4